jgi:hypothetical protein
MATFLQLVPPLCILLKGSETPARLDDEMPANIFSKFCICKQYYIIFVGALGQILE